MKVQGSIVHARAEEIEELLGHIRSEPTTTFVHIEAQGVDEKTTLLRLAWMDESVKGLLASLTLEGFYPYVKRGNVTSFVHERRLSQLWKPLIDGNYSQDENGIVYHFEKAASKPSRPRLLIIFSSMPPYIFTSSLNRYMTFNYQSMAKFSNKETSVLRIADFGGVLGNFYMDTKVHPKNSSNIMALIRRKMVELGVDSRDVVLLGSSKGGTGSVHYGLKMGLPYVAVDPVLSEDHYWEKFNDSHFTRDTVFQQTKDEFFDDLCTEERFQAFGEGQQVIIYSSRSPQLPNISRYLLERNPNGLFVDVLNEQINDHPDVAPKSLHVTTTLVSSMLAGIDIRNGQKAIL
ncbi:hypothetical protein FQA45_01380 [Glutamicibacter halophytocola]|uniref:XcbB/CpsF family capsular polysaccharide biosynthesis protein n=1 Tax=Glutamicibacter halophytocola TaxID=1933880 RepID=A0ABX5Y5W1_9MICC|nr:XcbB/CpsF family capsular polysaccharide biosynthesis protein [Glutamicibacter halophytocola]QDY65070.1 hypothetical protein FQA45_01380 [Glutamicibacter halophytocola]